MGGQKATPPRQKPRIGQKFASLKCNGGPAIGLDFGTCSCSAADYREKKFRIHMNDAVDRSSPSYISFDNKNYALLDIQAKKCYNDSSNHIMFGCKRLLVAGSTANKYNTILTAKFKLYEACGLNEISVGANSEGVPTFSPISPKCLCATHLDYLRTLADRSLRATPTAAVLPVPFSFGKTENDTIKEAALDVGFTDVELVPETVAAAIAYAVENQITTPTSVLVFNMGGGFTEACFIKGLTATRLSTRIAHRMDLGNSCGGEDFTQCIVDILTRRCKQETGFNIQFKEKLSHELRKNAEELKHALSQVDSIRFKFYEVGPGVDFEGELSVEEFRQECNRLLQDIRQNLQNLKNQIGEPVQRILLTGASSRLGVVRDVVRNVFQNATFEISINPDEAAVYGASVVAYNWKKGQVQWKEDYRMCNVNFDMPPTRPERGPNPRVGSVKNGESGVDANKAISNETAPQETPQLSTPSESTNAQENRAASEAGSEEQPLSTNTSESPRVQEDRAASEAGSEKHPRSTNTCDAAAVTANPVPGNGEAECSRSVSVAGTEFSPEIFGLTDDPTNGGHSDPQRVHETSVRVQMECFIRNNQRMLSCKTYIGKTQWLDDHPKASNSELEEQFKDAVRDMIEYNCELFDKERLIVTDDAISTLNKIRHEMTKAGRCELERLVNRLKFALPNTTEMMQCLIKSCHDKLPPEILSKWSGQVEEQSSRPEKVEEIFKEIQQVAEQRYGSNGLNPNSIVELEDMIANLERNQ